jgi:hypothetical protein
MPYLLYVMYETIITHGACSYIITTYAGSAPRPAIDITLPVERHKLVPLIFAVFVDLFCIAVSSKCT